MSPRRALTLLLCAWIVGCASEGGVTGTGISASVSGNVAQVYSAAAALPFAIRITVEEAPELTTVTAEDGTFALNGRFSGAVTLQFARAADDQPIGPLALEVPAGSVTLLENIAIDPTAPLDQRIQPGAVRQLDVVGRIDMAECAGDAETLLVTDGARPPRQFLVALTADTEILSRDGAALGCADLRPGRRVRVAGFLHLRTLTLVATEVVVAPPPTPPPDAPRRERFHGTAAAVDCARDEIALAQVADGEAVRRRLRLAADTDIECGAPPRPCRCAAIAVGDMLRGSGTIFPSAPGLVAVDAVTVLPGPPRRLPPTAGPTRRAADRRRPAN